MKAIRITIEKTENLYTAFAENVEEIYAGRETVDEVKESVLHSIHLITENNSPGDIPDVLKGKYNIIYTFDTESLLNYIKGSLLTPL